MAQRRHPQRNIVLSGFHGSGALEVGRRIARRLRRPLLDLPAEVQRRERLSLFRLTGLGRPPAPHKFEEWVVRDVAYRRESVVVLGVDTLSNPRNREELKVFSYRVFLDLPFALLWERIERDPALADTVLELGRQGVYELWLARRADYEDCDLQLFQPVDPPSLSKLITHCFYT